MNISETLTGKTDQLDNVELAGGPRDFTITGAVVRKGEQPLEITLAEHDKPWKPGLTMRRLIASIWGEESDAYIGRRVRLYRDPAIKFGAEQTGGTRISHASHLDGAKTVSLRTAKGKYGAFTVQPLPDATPKPTEPTEAEVAACTDDGQLRDWWHIASPERRAQIEARGRELATTPEGAES